MTLLLQVFQLQLIIINLSLTLRISEMGKLIQPLFQSMKMN
nr:hypothetical protein Iba_scaffold2471.2CG0240 [Ipomoea batatas]